MKISILHILSQQENNIIVANRQIVEHLLKRYFLIIITTTLVEAKEKPTFIIVWSTRSTVLFHPHYSLFFFRSPASSPEKFHKRERVLESTGGN